MAVPQTLREMIGLATQCLMELEAGEVTGAAQGGCSPDLNPIEQVFAKLKAALRAKAARTVEALWAALGELSAGLSPGECENYLRNSGHFQSA